MKLNFLSIAFCLFLIPFLLHSQEENVDAGIFSGLSPDTLIIKARPTYYIPGQSMTNAQLTIKWSEASPITSLQWLNSPVGLFPQGPVQTSEGYRYQVFGSFGGSNLNWAEGQEYTILRVKTGSISGECTKFEIAQDEWTGSNNGDYYFEILGEDRTGTRYLPEVNFGTDGGFIDGDTVIYLGNSTGTMLLTDYNGNVLQWERRINQGTWDILPGTAGLSSFEDIPTIEGVWEYRAKVEKTGCPWQYSEPATIIVELLAVWTGAVSTAWEDPGNWNIVGVPDETLDGKVPEISNGYYPVLNSAAHAKNLIIDPSAFLTIDREGDLSLAGFLKNDGVFALLSDTLSTASFIDCGIQGNGLFINELKYKSSQFHLFSSPIINSLTGSFEEMNLFVWEETEGKFFPVDSPLDTLVIMKGYLAANDDSGQDSLVFEGTGLGSGTYTANLINSGNDNGHTGGFYLAGNPYPSSINWNNDDHLIINQMDPAIYILNGATGNFGTYLRHDEGSTTLGIDSIIPANQGFFVHVSHNASSGSISLSNEIRLHDHLPISDKILFRSLEPYLKFQICGSQGQLKDETVVRFLQNATSGFDMPYDAYDLEGLIGSSRLYSLGEDSIQLAVNSYPPLNLNTDIHLGFNAGIEDNYLLSLKEFLNFGTDTLVLLEDKMLNLIYTLSGNFSLEFHAAPDDPADRFILHFQVEPIAINDPECSEAFKIFVLENSLLIIAENEQFEGEAELTDLSGKRLIYKRVSGPTASIEFPFSSGMYILRISGTNASFVKKLFVK